MTHRSMRPKEAARHPRARTFVGSWTTTHGGELAPRWRTWGLVAMACAIVSAAPSPAGANERALEATVFIRVIGDVTAAQGLDERFNRDKVEIPQVELGTGSGILISPLGYVVTNLHVIDSERKTVQYQGVTLDVTSTVTRIDVEIPARRSAAGPSRFQASVVATDADLDLAVLFIGASDLPYVPLGDSDAVQLGQPVSAVGYPLGRAVDLAAPTKDATPSPTLTTGSLSAVRRDNNGDARYLQMSASVNPGNSGGVLVDQEGYAIGVVQLKMRDVNDIGFAIPINVAKAFLATHGLDRSLPIPPFARVIAYDLRPKGLRFLAPDGFRDSTEEPTLVWSGQSLAGLSLRIGRIASTATAAELERALLDGRLVKGLSARTIWSRAASVSPGATARLGKATATDGTRMLYATVSHAKEAMVALYAGDPDSIAINESLLLESLQSLEVSPLPQAPPQALPQAQPEPRPRARPRP